MSALKARQARRASRTAEGCRICCEGRLFSSGFVGDPTGTSWVGLAGNAPGNAASKGATCVLGGSSYVAVSAAKGELGQRQQATSGVVQETGLRTGEELRIPFELDVQF